MNERERRFCEEYLIDLRARRAAVRAGYAPSTAKLAAAWIRPGRPLKPELRSEIDRMLAERARRIGVDADRVVQELANIAFGDADGAQEEPPEDARGAPGPVRTQDRLRALELLGKHLGMFAGSPRPDPAQPVIIDDSGGPAEAP